ncbi:hypothetical protein RJ639_037033 [Escallonia herrerae]|uniref:Uncharacterized protein n=1 Tax=Escallonia herrerae TaxID=1293975 RepID=A0AA88V1T2_9ASTE|nr:hypothetical protein RJ639_024370 [Escallonia herrerae]KAK3032856.1 hypothetical protein RJ639_037033 [Escallonia herrerae]
MKGHHCRLFLSRSHCLSVPTDQWSLPYIQQIADTYDKWLGITLMALYAHLQLADSNLRSYRKKEDKELCKLQVLLTATSWYCVIKRPSCKGLVLGVTGRHVNDVRFDDNRPVAGTCGVKRGDGPIVGEAVVAADDAEADDVALVIEDLEPLGAAGRRQAGDDVDFAEGTHVPVAYKNVAALDKVLVGLRVVEAADHRPDGGDGSGDLLDNGGAALRGAHRVRVEPRHRLRHRGGAGGQRAPPRGGGRMLLLSLFKAAGVRSGGGGVGIDSLE